MASAKEAGESFSHQISRGIGAAKDAEAAVIRRSRGGLRSSLGFARDKYNATANRRAKIAGGAAVSAGIIGGSAYATYKARNKAEKYDEAYDLEKGVFGTISRKIGIGAAGGMAAMRNAARTVRNSASARDAASNIATKDLLSVKRALRGRKPESVARGIASRSYDITYNNTMSSYSRSASKKAADAYNAGATRKMKTAAGATVTAGIVGGAAYGAYKASRRKKED
jgi:hypothetical protein